MKITFITGAGVSKESGVPTYRDSNDGLWLEYKVEEVSTAQAYAADPKKVIDFHNMIRKKLDTVKPNAAHKMIADLDKDHDVWVVTQNVDDLHERAGSKNVLHLHGELRKCRSSENPALTYPYDKDIEIGDTAEDGSQMRPNVVWFGEAVPDYGKACLKVGRADVVVIVGTSLLVTPASNLVEYVRESAKLYVVDPDDHPYNIPGRAEHIKMPATKGMAKFLKTLS